MLRETPICDFGWKAPDFTLQDPDGKPFTLLRNLEDVRMGSAAQREPELLDAMRQIALLIIPHPARQSACARP